jgi:hypothetical protein
MIKTEVIELLEEIMKENIEIKCFYNRKLLTLEKETSALQETIDYCIKHNEGK